jgi:hypothetical protein
MACSGIQGADHDGTHALHSRPEPSARIVNAPEANPSCPALRPSVRAQRSLRYGPQPEGQPSCPALRPLGKTRMTRKNNKFGFCGTFLRNKRLTGIIEASIRRLLAAAEKSSQAKKVIESSLNMLTDGFPCGTLCSKLPSLPARAGKCGNYCVTYADTCSRTAVLPR